MKLEQKEAILLSVYQSKTAHFAQVGVKDILAAADKIRGLDGKPPQPPESDRPLWARGLNDSDIAL